MWAGVRMLCQPLCLPGPSTGFLLLVLQLPHPATFSGFLGAPISPGSPYTPFLPHPADSGQVSPGRPDAQNFPWAVTKHPAVPWDPSPVCTNELTGFVPSKTAMLARARPV